MYSISIWSQHDIVKCQIIEMDNNDPRLNPDDIYKFSFSTENEAQEFADILKKKYFENMNNCARQLQNARENYEKNSSIDYNNFKRKKKLLKLNEK